MDIATLVENDDVLRPQPTFGYKKSWTAEPYDFPNSYIKEPFIPVMNWKPIDTYADDVNKRFVERYGKNAPLQ